MDAASLAHFLGQKHKADTAVYGATIYIDGRPYAAATAGVSKLPKLKGSGQQGGGFVFETDIKFRVAKELFDAEPAAGTKLTHDDVIYRIVRVFKSAFDPCYHLTCENPNQS